ncbi:MAG: hypothetical protein Q4F00_07470, partial [bacterium]|nr:hypothetical protein [bacterium]
MPQALSLNLLTKATEQTLTTAKQLNIIIPKNISEIISKLIRFLYSFFSLLKFTLLLNTRLINRSSRKPYSV